MPLSAAHKQRSRQSILDSAVTLFTQLGYDNTSIDQIMAHAQMTRGAFYAHFSSKSNLYQQAILNAARGTRLAGKKPQQMKDREWIDKLLDGYLSTAHLDGKQPPCPMAFLSTDIAIREPEVRSTYTQVYKNMNRILQQHTESFSQCDEDDLFAITAMLIGGVAIGRAVNEKATARKILKAVRRTIEDMLEQ